MRAILATLLVALAQSALAGDAINNSEEAMACFRAIMRARMEERTGTRVSEDTQNEAKTSARASTSLAVHQHVKSTLLPDQFKSAIRVGSLTDLLPDRNVWIVSHALDVFSGFDAVMDARDGKLIFLWFIPEG